jgi:FlaA1/EpsC-like NDP-sugar epimerase
MIRRNAVWFRALLMAADALIAVVLLLGLSVWRFGDDWAVWWRQIVPVPEGLLVIFAASWVIALSMNGLYRPRARWSIVREAIDVLQATIILSLVTLSVLFLFRLPEVSRQYMLILFPALAAATVTSRILLRLAMEELRRHGKNLRFVLVLGAGPRGQAFAGKLEGHRELGLRVVGFLDDSPAFDLPGGWNYLGTLEALESVLHSRVVDEVAICLPFSQWSLIDTITRVCEEEGKIVRIPMDVLDRAISVGKVEELDGTPVFSLV